MKDAVPVQQLLALARLSNQAVGDALSGILMVEAALSLLNWDLNVWHDLYHDLPSRQLKVQAVLSSHHLCAMLLMCCKADHAGCCCCSGMSCLGNRTQLTWGCR